MNTPGDMWRVAYPDDTGPRHQPLGLDWTKRTEDTDMVEDKDFIYVNLYGEEVAPNDPAAQTKYSAAELKALRKGGFFPKAPGAPIEEAAADESHPVLNSGIGAKGADSPDAAAADDGADAAADDDEKKPGRHVAAKK